MTETHPLLQFLPVFIVAATAVVFAIRIEGEIAVVSKETEAIWRQIRTDQMVSKESRDEVSKSLRQMDTKLDRIIERMIK